MKDGCAFIGIQYVIGLKTPCRTFCVHTARLSISKTFKRPTPYPLSISCTKANKYLFVVPLNQTFGFRVLSLCGLNLSSLESMNHGLYLHWK